jgi:hypothetical protein
MIGLQIIFNIEKLIKIIYESITIIHFNRCADTHLNKMYIEEFIIVRYVLCTNLTKLINFRLNYTFDLLTFTNL